MYTTNVAYAQLNSVSWKMSLQVAIWLVPIRRNKLYLNRRTGRKTNDQKKAVGTLLWSQERAVLYLCSFEAQIQKGGKKIQLIFQSLFITFFQVNDLNHTPVFWNLSEVFWCSEQVISNTENTWILVLFHALSESCHNVTDDFNHTATLISCPGSIQNLSWLGFWC